MVVALALSLIIAPDAASALQSYAITGAGTSLHFARAGQPMAIAVYRQLRYRIEHRFAHPHNAGTHGNSH
jgi:hypothetical protein